MYSISTIQFSEGHQEIQQRADSLKKILSSIPRIIDERPVFLEVCIEKYMIKQNVILRQ